MEDKIIYFDSTTPKIEQANKVRSVLAVNGSDGTIGAVGFDLLVLEAGKNVGDAVKIDGLVLPTLGDVNKKTTVRGGATGKTFTYTDPETSQVTTIEVGVNMVADLFWDGELKTWSKVDEDELPMQDVSTKLDKSSIEITSTNLFDKINNSVTGSYYRATDGLIITSANYTRTIDLIRLDRSKSRLFFRRKNGVSHVGAFYGENGLGDFISGMMVTGDNLYPSFEIPQNAVYAGINISNTLTGLQQVLDSFMFSYENVPFTPFSPFLKSIDGVPVNVSSSSNDDSSFFPFADGMSMKSNINVQNSVLDIEIEGEPVDATLYLKQFGRYALTSPPDRRWFFELWNSDGLKYGGNNSTGRWTRNEDFTGIEDVELFDQSGKKVGFVKIDWSKAWASDGASGGYFNNGTIDDGRLSSDIFKNPQLASVHPLKGLKCVLNGDSIMAASNSFGLRACRAIGMEVISNYAIGGSTIAQQSANPNGRNPISIRFVEMDDSADVVIIAAGTNDCNYSWTPFGTFSDRTVNTFYGALHVVCEGLKKKYLGKLIVFLTPIKRNQDLPTPESTNAYGKTQKDYADAVKEVCGYWGIPVLDNFNECPINPFIPEYIFPYIPDGTHPSALGHEIMSHDLVGYLRRFK